MAIDNLLESCLGYNTLGWSTVLARKMDKLPIKSWKQYQTKPPTPQEITNDCNKYPESNIAIITGKVSGLIVIDIDSSEGMEKYIAECGELHQTIQAKTGRADGEGLHLYFKHPGDGHYANMAKVLPGIDVRGDGGYVIGPPSLHESGNTYQWLNINPLEDGLDDLMDLPDDVKAMLYKKDPNKTPNNEPKNSADWVNDALLGVEAGNRNETAAKLAGYYVLMGHNSSEIESLLRIWNIQNLPPLEFKEIRKIVNSIVSREGEKGLEDLLGGIGKDKVLIDKIERLIYADGTIKFNVKLIGYGNYVQCDMKELGTFSTFKWKFGEIVNYIPDTIKQATWERRVNNALDNAKEVKISDEETNLGAVAHTINSVLSNKNVGFDVDRIDRQVVVVGENGNRKIATKMPVLLNMIRVEGERVDRKEMGEILRRLNFSNQSGLKNSDRKTVRCWVTGFDAWKEKYDLNMDFD